MSAGEAVTPLHPETIQLIPEERLRSETIQLKRQLLEATIQIAKETMSYSQDELIRQVKERTGADLGRYSVDVVTGVCTLEKKQ